MAENEKNIANPMEDPAQDLANQAATGPTAEVEDLLSRIHSIPDWALGQLEGKTGQLISSEIAGIIRGVSSLDPRSRHALFYVLIGDASSLLTQYRQACRYLAKGWIPPTA